MSNATTVYNATESTLTANFPIASNKTRPTTEISPVSVQQARPITVKNIHQQILSHDLLKQSPFKNKQLILIRAIIISASCWEKMYRRRGALVFWI